MPIHSFFIPVAFIIGMISAAVQNSKKRDLALRRQADAKAKAASIRSYFDQVADFSITHRRYDHDLERSIALDERAGLICLVDPTAPEVHHSIYRPADLLDVAVIEDGTTVSETRTARGSQLGGALVGGVPFGGAGAIVGGLSGTQVTSSAAHRLRAVSSPSSQYSSSPKDRMTFQTKPIREK